MPYYQLQGAPNGDSYQVYAESPEQAKMRASPRLQVPVSAITIRYSSPSQIVNVPFVPGTGPGGIDTDTGTAGMGSIAEIAQRAIGGTDEATRQSFISQFRRALDAGGQTALASPFRAYLNRQQEPALDTFELQSVLGRTTANPQQYVAGLGKGQEFGHNLTANAGDAWRELQRQSAAGGPPTSEKYLAADPGEDIAALLGNVARRGAREKYGVWGAAALTDPNEVYQRYLAQPQGAGFGTQNKLIDFLKRAYGY